MRKTILRSFLRAVIAVGVIFSHQQAAFSTSWKELLTPHAGICFLHDLNWERLSVFPLNGGSPIANQMEAPVTAPKSIPTRREYDECLASARRFEVASHATAMWRFVLQNADKIQSQFSSNAYRFSGGAVAKSIANHAVRLTNATIHPELSPISRIKPSSLSAIAGNGTNLTEDAFFDDAILHWNCDDWNCNQFNDHTNDHAIPSETDVVQNAFPARSTPNIFVFMLSSYDTNDSSQTALDEIDPELSISKSPKNIWQLGVDPLCPDITTSYQVSSFGLQSFSSVDNEVEAVATSILEPTRQTTTVRPPILEAELNSLAMTELQDGFDSGFQEEFAAEFDDGIEYCKATVETERLDSRSVAIRSQYRQGLIHQIQDCVNHSFPRWSPSAAPWQIPFQLDHWLKEGIATYTNAIPKESEPASISRFSREDLQYAQRLSRLILNATQEEASTSLEATLHRSYESAPDIGTLLLPLSVSQRIAIEYAEKHFVQPSRTLRLLASKAVASQLRVLGQSIVDLSANMDQVAATMEIANRQNESTVK